MARKLHNHLNEPMNMHILAIDDDRKFLNVLHLGLGEKFRFVGVNDFYQAKIYLAKNRVDFVLLDISLGDENGIQLIKEIQAINPTADVIIVTGHKDPDFLLEAIREGASDYLVKPFEMNEVLAIIEKLIPYRNRTTSHDVHNQDSRAFEEPIIGFSLGEQLSRVHKLKGKQANILIEGETGTGKELFARYVHRIEEKPDRPFIAINCAAIPENLLESELFGHEKGAFTGAHERKVGKFELAHQGDLFLDEIPSLKKDLQAKILRAIEEQEIFRLGGIKPVKISFRVIAASNENLESLVEVGRFRLDLFHRLRVATISIPPLRERKEDIPLLVDVFLKKYAKPLTYFNKEAMMTLSHYSWPGNVRELENLIQNVSIFSSGQVITIADLPEWIFAPEKMGNGNASKADKNGFTLPLAPHEFLPLKEYVTKAEKAYVERALSVANGDKGRAAAILQVSRTRLYERLKSWGMT